MKQLKQLLSMECSYQLRDEIMDQFISSMEEITLHQGDILIADGSLDSNIYIVKEGIMAHTYLSGAKDCCWGFSLPGTMMYSLHPYYFNKPAFYQVIACCDSVVMKQSKERFDNLIADWKNLAKNTNTKLLIGLATYKINTPNEPDKQEWANGTQVITRQTQICRSEKEISGHIYFSYSSMCEYL